jgi:hypothetical protein
LGFLCALLAVSAASNEPVAITGEDCAKDPTCSHYENDNDNESNGVPGKFAIFRESTAAAEFDDDDYDEGDSSLSRSQFRSVVSQALALMVQGELDESINALLRDMFEHAALFDSTGLIPSAVSEII